LHKCDNSICVNPSHLEIGDAKKNMEDASARNRFVNRMPNITADKLSNEQVIEIRRLYKSKILTQSKLAIKFGIDQSTVSLIVNRKIWKDL